MGLANKKEVGRCHEVERKIAGPDGASRSKVIHELAASAKPHGHAGKPREEPVVVAAPSAEATAISVERETGNKRERGSR